MPTLQDLNLILDVDDVLRAKGGDPAAAIIVKSWHTIRHCRIIKTGMVFIETSVFTRVIADYLTDDEYAGLQSFLLQRPDTRAIIRGTGGVRKLRWRISGRGKSGGIRVIYYWYVSEDEIWLLTAYGKSERDTIPAHTLKQIVDEMKDV